MTYQSLKDPVTYSVQPSPSSPGAQCFPRTVKMGFLVSLTDLSSEKSLFFCLHR